jgi:histidine triad (HIT) family protein
MTNDQRLATDDERPMTNDRRRTTNDERPTTNDERRTTMNDCLFCKIIAREVPGSIVYEDERVLAFNDINPQAPTHVLIVPKRHVASLGDLTAEDDQMVGELVRRAAAIAKERGIAAGGFRTVFNTNRDAGQTVFHIHLHLIGGRRLHWPPG